MNLWSLLILPRAKSLGKAIPLLNSNSDLANCFKYPLDAVGTDAYTSFPFSIYLVCFLLITYVGPFLLKKRQCDVPSESYFWWGNNFKVPPTTAAQSTSSCLQKRTPPPHPPPQNHIFMYTIYTYMYMPSCGVFHNGTGVLSINFFSSLELYYLNPGYKEQFWLCIYEYFLC